MKKYLIMSLFFILCTLTIVFAEDDISILIEDYYASELTLDVENLLSFYNMDYVNRVIADTDTFRTYIAAAYEVYEPLSSEVNNIAIDQSEMGDYALVKYDVIGLFRIKETNEEVPLNKTYGAYVEYTENGWKINFIMDYDMLVLKLEAGSLYALNLLTDEIADEQLSIYEATLSQDQQMSDVEEAIASLNEFNAKSEEAVSEAIIEQEEVTVVEEVEVIERTESDSDIDYEKLIDDYEQHEKNKTMWVIIPLILLGIGTVVYLKFVRKKE